LVKSVAHRANACKEIGVHQGGNRLSILVHHDAGLLILDLVKHLAQVLAKIDGINLGDHCALQS